MAQLALVRQWISAGPFRLFGKENFLFAILLLFMWALFVAIKFYVALAYDGSFIDEYRHIFAGLDFISKGEFPRYYAEQAAYNRGAHISWITGLLLTTFGKSIFVAKLASIFIGVVNFVLLAILAKYTLRQKKYILLLLVIYTFSPWVIFNHFYIRFYIVYEFFLLSLLLLSQRMLVAARENRWSGVLISISMVAALNILNLIFSNDTGKHTLTLSTAMVFGYLYIFESNALTLSSSKMPWRILGKILSANRILKIVALIAIAVAAYFLFDLQEKATFLLTGSLKYGGKDGRYRDFFFHKNTLFAAFFLLSVASIWAYKSSMQRLVTLVGGMLLLLHMLSSGDLQIVRGILYFVPLFYLVSLISLSQLKYLSNNLLFVVVALGLLLTICEDYPQGFVEHPFVPHEIHPVDYKLLYDEVKQSCESDAAIIEASPSAFIARFYDVKPDYVFVGTKHKKSANYYYDKEQKLYRTVYGDIPIIERYEHIERLKKDVCLIVRSPSRRRFVPRAVYHKLKKTIRHETFKSMELFHIPAR